MEQIPQFARGRMQKADSGAHPDPDLLTAFMERALPEAQRGRILDHLSSCTECREVVSLALPELPTTQTVFVRRPSWTATMRWVAAGSALVIVAAVGIRYTHTAPKESVAARAVSPTTATANPAAPAPQPTLESPREQLSAKLEVPQKPEVARHAESKKLSIDETGKKLSTAETSEQAFNAPSPTGMPRANEDRDASAGIAAVAPAARADMTQTANLSPETAQPSMDAKDTTEMADAALGKAKAPMRSAAVGNLAGSRNAMAAKTMAKEEVTTNASGVNTPRWTLSSDGTLQRSFDSGQTWQNVALPTSAVLRALAASASEIWVGGSSGSLFHSSDAGSHWLQVRPAAAGKSLTADIIGVEFTDPEHGKVTTSDQQVWTTNDGGRSWDIR